jgi:hypothetical protein
LEIFSVDRKFLWLSIQKTEKRKGVPYLAM